MASILSELGAVTDWPVPVDNSPSHGVRDLKVWIGLLGGADALVRGRPPGRPFFLGEKIGVLAEQSGHGALSATTSARL